MESGQNDSNDLMQTITAINRLVLNVDLPYVIKNFELPKFMNKIMTQADQIQTQAEQIQRLEKVLKAKDRKIEFLVG